MKPTRRTAVLILAALSTILITARLRSYYQLIGIDIGTYAVAAREVLDGKRLYADVWDIKPPAIFATYGAMQSLVGDGQLPIYLLSVLMAVTTMLGVYNAAAIAGRVAGIWAAIFWVTMCYDPWTGADLPNTEVFISAAICWAFGLWLRGLESWRRTCGIAVLFAIASLYKHVAVAPAICLGAIELLFPLAGQRRRRDLPLRLIVMAAIGLIAWIAVLGYFVATERGWIIWQTLFIAPREYAGSVMQNLATSLTWPRAGVLLFALPGVALVVIGAMMGDRAALRRAWRLYAALLLGTHLAVALPGAFVDHYYQLWFMPIAIGAGWGAASMLQMRRVRCPWFARAFAALAALAVLYPQISWYSLSGREWSRRKYGDMLLWADDSIRQVDHMLLPGETFYMWNDEAWAYAAAHRHPPAITLWRDHALRGPLAEYLTRRTIADLERTKPEMVIIWGDDLGPAGHPIAEWTRRNYEMIPTRKYYPLFLYVRRDGALQRRLAN